ncbi:hypothetical protein [Rhodococcus globerulus]|uniref:hypothetical protein n=1 Tax=Rhodococcus globerulus TaxID=33008 RepID=UPI000AC2C331|nr:hypothetical protein [Rhodococcus globerulus]PVX59539.1 hypothetical protein C8E04_6106 [Rhodococcus globerulus]
MAAEQVHVARQESSILTVRTKRRFEAVTTLKNEGMGIRTIARQLGLARETVRRFYYANSVEELLGAPWAGRPTVLDRFAVHLRPDHSHHSDWEVIAESAIESRENLLLTTAAGSVISTLEPIPSGRYHIRAYARGRDINAGLEVHEPSEHYLFHLWPHEPDSMIDLEVRQILETDTAWSTEPSASNQPTEDDIDSRIVTIIGPDGDPVRVGVYSPEAEADRAQRAHFGDRPLSAELESLYSAQYMAGFDRELVERIEQLDETDQRAFARWCVHRAFDRAGISHIDWIAEGLDAVDKGRSRPEAFENGMVSAARLTADPRIIRTINTGIPGSADVIPQYQALAAFENDTAEELPPLEAAINALQHAAWTYGMDYHELLQSARTNFLDRL